MNVPYWSLCYEVWFYVMFGVYCFAPKAWRWPALGLLAVLAGPAILVLLPIWALGALMAAKGWHHRRMSLPIALATFLGSIGVVVAIDAFAIDQTIQRALYESVPGFWRLGSSQNFVTDIIIGAVFCAHLVSFSSLPQRVQAVFAWARPAIAGLAGFSFTLYLFHRPMTQVLGAWAPQPKEAVAVTAAMAVGIVAVCWLLSFITERQLPRWRAALDRVLPKGAAA
jgi:peptidoglycan/LPS O-acetylase OafA/YrhL